MWIRRMPRRWRVKDGWHEAVYYTVVESYRDESGQPRHRTIEALGPYPPDAHVRMWRRRVRYARRQARYYAAEAANAVFPDERRRMERRVRFYTEDAATARARVKWYENLQRKFDSRGDPTYRPRRPDPDEAPVDAWAAQLAGGGPGPPPVLPESPLGRSR